MTIGKKTIDTANTSNVYSRSSRLQVFCKVEVLKHLAKSTWKHVVLEPLLGFFIFVLSNKYYLSKLMIIDFRCQKICFLCKDNFLYRWETYAITLRYESKNISWKYFMVHEMLLKLYFMKFSERKISQCILPLRIPFIYLQARIFFFFLNMLFKMLEYNSLYYKKKPCVKTLCDLFIL